MNAKICEYHGSLLRLISTRVPSPYRGSPPQPLSFFRARACFVCNALPDALLEGAPNGACGRRLRGRTRVTRGPAPGYWNCALTLNVISWPAGCEIDSVCVLMISTDRLKEPVASRFATKSERPVSVVHRPSMTTAAPVCFRAVSHVICGSARLI